MSNEIQRTGEHLPQLNERVKARRRQEKPETKVLYRYKMYYTSHVDEVFLAKSARNTREFVHYLSAIKLEVWHKLGPKLMNYLSTGAEITCRLTYEEYLDPCGRQKMFLFILNLISDQPLEANESLQEVLE